MSIFQKSIVEKYLKTLDEDVLEKAYDSYKEVYSAQKIQRIKKLKEEQYQGGFLKDIFGSVLGYTIDPEVGYNIELEKKNETNSKKADGAILQDEKVLGVIELKSNKTKNLDSIKDQAFGYKNNHKGCKYVISSNFHKLRFYVDDATEYEEFDLYNLNEETFKRFYLYLRKEGLLDKNIPKLLKEETKFHEENISKQLYKDYSTFKNKFFENIVKNNPEHNKLLLFKKSQKFLDRILFVLFAEDKELIPTNAISRIVESWVLADDLHYKPLYELFTILFEHLNVGHTYKSGYEIPAYNGGLFAPDDILDNLKVDDKILKDDLLTLSKYDFNTDVDVNILGHIFEHSLSEIEEIEAELKGEESDKSKGKRKKDGVFYTPKYITKYIVDNTVGKLCSEKKEVLGLDIDFDIQDYQKSNGTVNVKGKELFHTLESYKEWLLSLKILDPACGSGAFLNQALTFLIEEHKNIDDIIAELTNTPLRIFDTDKSILENNIFGVDINDESVEIAKLSLWLRTAQKGRKLSNLNNNIKCGNSLIDDPVVAGDKAFNWEDEFPEIFKNGGFDVVIGNPPYVRVQNLSNDDVDYYFSRYQTPTGKLDLSILFFEKSFELVNPNGIISFISSSQWMQTDYGKNIRKIIIENKLLHEIIDFGTLPVFQDASTYPAIFSFSKIAKENIRVKKITQKQHLNIESIYSNASISVNYKLISDVAWNFGGFNLMTHLDKNKIKWNKLSEYGKAYYGVVTGMDKAFIVTDEIIKSKNLEKEIIKPYAYKGEEVNRYETTKPSQLTIYPYKKGENGDSILLKEQELKSKYPNIYEYISNFRSELEQRKDSRKLYATGENWFRNVRQGNFNLIEAEKLQIRGIGKRVLAGSLSKDTCFSGANCPAIIINNTLNSYACLAILNSTLITYYLNSVCPKKLGGYTRYNTKNISLTPIVLFDKDSEKNVVQLVSHILENNNQLVRLYNTTQRYIQSQFSIEKLTKKLQNWYELDFEEFIKELNKSIKKVGGEKLSKMDEMDWMEVFETKKSEIQILKTEIDKTDRKIDQMVYELYGLTEDEIQIVEDN